MSKRCQEVVPLLGPLLDNELAADDRAWVEDHLPGCASCRDRLALIAAQGQAIREALEARAAAARLDGFADRVLARAGTANVVELTPVWVREMWGAHRGAFAAAVGVALAACMALGVFFVPGQPPLQVPGQQPQAQEEPAILAEASGPTIDEVDFGTHDGAVLQLSGDTPVIWMSDDRAVPQ